MSLIFNIPRLAEWPMFNEPYLNTLSIRQTNRSPVKHKLRENINRPFSSVMHVIPKSVVKTCSLVVYIIDPKKALLRVQPTSSNLFGELVWVLIPSIGQHITTLVDMKYRFFRYIWMTLFSVSVRHLPENFSYLRNTIRMSNNSHNVVQRKKTVALDFRVHIFALGTTGQQFY